MLTYLHGKSASWSSMTAAGRGAAVSLLWHRPAPGAGAGAPGCPLVAGQSCTRAQHSVCDLLRTNAGIRALRSVLGGVRSCQQMDAEGLSVHCSSRVPPSPPAIHVELHGPIPCGVLRQARVRALFSGCLHATCAAAAVLGGSNGRAQRQQL